MADRPPRPGELDADDGGDLDDEADLVLLELLQVPPRLGRYCLLCGDRGLDPRCRRCGAATAVEC